MPQALGIATPVTPTDLLNLLSKVEPKERVRGAGLLAGPDRAALGARLNGRAKFESDDARKTLHKIANQTRNQITANSQRHLTASDQKDIASIFAAVDACIDSDSARSPKGKGVLLLAQSMQGAVDFSNQVQPATTARGPRLADARTDAISSAARELIRATQSGEDTGPIAKRLGGALADAFKKRAGTEARHAFAFSTGDRFKAELGEALRGEMGSEAAKIDPPKLTSFLDAAFNQAASQMLPDYAIEDSAKLNNPRAPTIVVGDVQYRPTKVLGAGAMGIVYEYQSENGSKLAYKVPKNIPMEHILNEPKQHRAACGDKHPNILPYRGATRSADGSVGIIMDLAPGGDALTASEKIGSAVTDGLVTQEQADVLRLEMFRAIVDGALHLHTHQTLIHSDIKPRNVLIDDKGNAMLGDFGITKEGTRRHHDSMGGSPLYYMAPEYGRADEVESSMIASSEMREELQEAFPQATPRQLDCLTRSALLPQITNAREAMFLTNKVDTFALGETALAIFLGREDPRMRSAQLRDIVVGNSDVQGRSRIGLTTGLPAADKLITELLDQDPDKRPGLLDALLQEAFEVPGVGTPEARELLAALNSADQTRIGNARDALELQRLAVRLQ